MWSTWNDLGGGITNLAVGVNRDGRLEVFAIGTSKELLHIWQTADASGAVQPVFPISASQFNDLSGSGGQMTTDVTIFASGLLNAVTETHEMTVLRGFNGAVAVLLLDQNQTQLWVSATQNFGVDGTALGTSDRHDNWSDNVPSAILPQVRYIAIIQQWNPRGVVADIKNWLGGIGPIAQALGPIIQIVKTIASLI
jgi:hypothetical protein